MSPSKQFVATTNLYNGVDFFSLKKRTFVANYDYLQLTSSSGGAFVNRIVQAAFLNNNILIAGHFDACVYLLAVGEDGVQSSLRVNLPQGNPDTGDVSEFQALTVYIDQYLFQVPS